jgi:hypothetical protein
VDTVEWSSVSMAFITAHLTGKSEKVFVLQSVVTVNIVPR